jgi:hypothetical protein
MATGLVYESPYWIGWLAGSWGLSWGYSADGTPIEVDEPVYYGGGKASRESDEERTRLFREHHEYLDAIKVRVADDAGKVTTVAIPKTMTLPASVKARAMRGNVATIDPPETVADILNDPVALGFVALLMIEAIEP